MASSELNFNNMYERIVVLVDMDCFYCQVEEKLNPQLKGKPMAVVQYNAWMGGGIIAVNYEARARGVTRHMRGNEAKKHCPEIELVRVPSVREKADLTKYRDAGKDVARVLQSFTQNLERASVDEAYLDITNNVLERIKEMDRGEYVIDPKDVTNTFAVGHKTFGDFVKSLKTKMATQDTQENDEIEDFRAVNDSCKSNETDVKKRNELKLVVAATIVNDIRCAVKEQTGYECSAGIAHNKILAKLVAGLNKPNKQTIVSIDCVQVLFEDLPILKVRGLGGKFGEIVCQKLNVKVMGNLLEFTEAELQKAFNEKDGTWLYYLVRGIDIEPVVTRLISKSIGCTKKFPGKNAISGVNTLKHWLKELAGEVVDRLEKDHEENNRRGKLLTVSFDRDDCSNSRSVQLDAYNAEKIADDAFEVMKKNTETFYAPENPSMLNNPIKLLGLSVSKFEKNPVPKKNRIQEMFKKQETKKKEAEKSPEKLDESAGFFEEYLEKGTQVEPKEQESPKPSTSFVTLPESPEKSEKEHSNDSDEISAKPSTSHVTLPESPEKPEKGHSNHSDGFLNAFLEKETEDILMESPTKLPDNADDPQPSTSKNNERTPQKIPENIYEATTPEYKKTYAEFARPAVPEDFMTICEKCNKRISLHEAATHADYHYGLQVSQEQRMEFRNEIKQKIITQPAAKKMKMTKGKPSAPVTITKFLRKSEESRKESSKPTEKCSECGKQIPIEEFAEHADYHMAKKLQMEENQRNSPISLTQNTQVVKKKNSKASKCKNIINYFSGNK